MERGKQMKAINIKWDTDGDMQLLNELPTEMEVPEDLINDISDYAEKFLIMSLIIYLIRLDFAIMDLIW